MSFNKKLKSVSSKFINANITNYILAYLFVMMTIIIILVFYQYYVNGVLPPDVFLDLIFRIFFVELVAMAGIAISKNVFKKKEDDNYE